MSKCWFKHHWIYHVHGIAWFTEYGIKRCGRCKQERFFTRSAVTYTGKLDLLYPIATPQSKEGE